MKVFAILLSVYILLLSGIPCADVAVHHDTCKAELTRTASAAHQGDVDHCSPFCSCQCCQAGCQISGQPMEFTVPGSVIAYYTNNTPLKSLDLFEFLIPPKA